MATSSVTYDKETITTFLNNLSEVNNKITQDSSSSDLATALPKDFLDRAGVDVEPAPPSKTTTTNTFNTFLSQLYSTTNVNTWVDFAGLWDNYAYNTMGVQSTNNDSTFTNSNLYNYFFNIFLDATQNTYSSSQGLSGDWDVLTGSTGGAAINFNFTNPTVTIDNNSNTWTSSTDTSKNAFILVFNQFLQNLDRNQFKVTSSYDGAENMSKLVDAFDTFLTTTTVLQENTVTSVDLVSYQKLYESFASSDATFSDFATALKKFVQNALTKHGYFLPSMLTSEWINTIKQPTTDLSVDNTSLASNNAVKVQIINRIIRLLIAIIQTLQNVGIAQSNRLRFTTQYQQAYTTLQTQIPVFLKGDYGGQGIGKGNTDGANARNELNASFNSVLTDNIRSLRGIQEDNAKKIQSNVNQTNDMVNQQTDMCTSFIQDMTNLLGVVLRS